MKLVQWFDQILQRHLSSKQYKQQDRTRYLYEYMKESVQWELPYLILSNLIKTMVHADNAMSIPRTMNALQDCINYIEGLCMMYIGHVVLVCGCTKATDLRHNVESTHHECAARLHQMHRGALHDVYRARSACLRGNHLRLVSSGDQLGRSKPVQGWGISALLSHGLGSGHH